MGEGTYAETRSNFKVKQISSNAIERLNSEGKREENYSLQIVDKAREAMVKMPEGKSGIVLGTGSKSELWRQRGWLTLDIDPDAGADITADANELGQYFLSGSQDYVLAECIRMDRTGRVGVGRARILSESNKVLKMGGSLIVVTASFTKEDGSSGDYVPSRQFFECLMVKHGFQVVTELKTNINHFPEGDTEQGVIYYGKKVEEGFDDKRAEKL